jgi:CubicO group peptidase (beta-lactamase class C family)
MLRSFAVGHLVKEDGPRVAKPWPIPRGSNPAGGIASSARDQMRYARFHMGDGTNEQGERVLSTESLKLMQTPAVSAWAGAHSGIAWFLTETEGTKIVAHGGGTNGQISAFLFAPERNFALTILTNADKGGSLTAAVQKVALKHLLGIEEAAPVPIDRTDEQLAPYTGEYAVSTSRMVLTAREGKIFIEMISTSPGLGDEPRETPPPAPAALYEEDRIVVLEGPFKDAKGEFLRNPDGSVAFLRLGGRAHKRTT